MAGRWRGNVYYGDGDDERVAGRPSDDTIYGAGGSDTLSGSLGDDRVEGGEGDDSLSGGAGDDFIVLDGENVRDDDTADGGDGDDYLYGGSGADLMIGGMGNDTLDPNLFDQAIDTLIGGAGSDLFTANATRATGSIVMKGDLAGGATVSFSGATVARLSSVERVSIIEGFNRNDVLIGGVDDDFIEAGLGRDSIKTGDGDDVLRFRIDGGRDDIDLGGGSRDRVVIDPRFGQDGDFVVDMRGDPSLKIGNGAEMIFRGAEYLEVSAGAGDDRFIGSEHSASFDAGTGMNVIDGGGGEEYFSATLDRSLDRISGGGGRDFLALFGAEDAITVETRGSNGLEVSVGGRLVAISDGIEAFSLGGSEQGDQLAGLGGGDYLRGEGGRDLLEGGGGDDFLIGGLGADKIFGGKGADTVDFYEAGGDVKVALAGGAARAEVDGDRSDLLRSIENLVGGLGDDTLIGDDGDNLISGGSAGQDVLNGGKGFDVLSLRGVTGDFEIVLKGGQSDTLATDFGGSVTYRNFEGVVGSDFDDVIRGDARRNMIEGAAGADTMTGGDGGDEFVFKSSAASEPKRADVITDFSGAEGDRLDLSQFTFDQTSGGITFFDEVDVRFVGEAKFSGAAGELRFKSGETSSLLCDLDGDKIADFEINFSNGAKIGAADLIL